MAFMLDPRWGSVPGAPHGTNWWTGNTFNMSGIMPQLPPPAPPAPPLAATPTLQDLTTRQAAAALTAGAGGAEPGGGGPGYGAGGIGQAPTPGQPNPGMGGGVYAPGGDLTFSGFPGVYAQAPDEMNSQFGQAGGMLGMAGGALGGIPGVGTAASALGGALDAARYNGVNAQYGIPGSVNPWGSALASALSGIGVPFTDLNLARAFGVQTARERQNALLDAYGQPVSRESVGYGALAANEPHTPGAPFGNTGWAAGMDQTRGSYPGGFLDSGLQPSHGLPTEQAAQLNLDVERTIAGNPDVFGTAGQAAAPSAGGVWNDLFGGAGNFGNEGQSVDPAAGGNSFGSGGFAGLWAKGGKIPPPPAGAINPPGPDDQVGGLQTGEGVLTAAAVKRFPGLLAAANAGKLDPAKVKGLLGAMPARRAR